MIASDPEIKILSETLDYHPIVREYLDILGLRDKIVYIDKSQTYKAELMYTSCAAPTFHQVLSKLGEQIFLSSGLSKNSNFSNRSAFVPLEKRKYLVYGSRLGMRNGRPVYNEHQLINELQSWVETNTTYQFVDFNTYMKTHKSLEEQRELFSGAVALVGAHGGFFTNGYFCYENTIVIEAQSVQQNNDVFYVSNSILLHPYYRVYADNGGGGLKVTASDYIDILKENFPSSSMK